MKIAERLAAVRTPRGELVLRRRGEVLELISNGTFLMDTASGASEAAMARAALAGQPAGARVLIGGLGFGFTLASALDFDVAEVVVVEVEPDVVAWNRQWWPLARAALDDSRVTVVVDDLVRVIDTVETTFDAVLLDIDNGPGWTVTDANSRLYDDARLARLAGLLTTPGGRLCIWSADPAPELETRLHRHFAETTTLEIPVARGNPDVLLLATR